MKEIAEKYENEKLKIDKKIVFGDRVREIITYAQDNDIDLIVLSSHKIDRTNPAEGWGTISYKVGILSHCPVMMVK
jgi:universal stress protein A